MHDVTAMLTSRHFQRHYQNCDSASTPQSGTSHETCLRGFGGNGSIAWTSAVSHVGAHIECILGHYETANIPLSDGINIMYFCSVFVKIWFFAKSSDTLYPPCTSIIYTHPVLNAFALGCSRTSNGGC